VLFVAPTVVFGASLSFSPSSGTYKPGAVFTVAIYVNSGGQALNAVSGIVSYPKDLLEVVSVSKNQSIVSLWVQEPNFSNEDAIVNFEGIVLNPGFSGLKGKVLEVTFRAKKEGNPSLSFTSGSILANDGEGSEILSSREKALYAVTAPAAVVADPEAAPEEVALLAAPEKKSKVVPEVISNSHPKDGWSASSTGVFNFSFSDDVVALRLLLDTTPDSVPTIVYAPPIASREIEELEEGVSYLHVQYKDAQGWGDILHYKVQIDTTAPEVLDIQEINPGVFLLESADELSGVSRYEVQIDDGAVVEFIDDGSHVYKAPELTSGQHKLFVKAFDAAGNFVTATVEFEIHHEVVLDTPIQQSQGEELEGSPLVSHGAILITALSVIIPLLALLLLLGLLLYITWRSVGGFKKRVDKEVREATLIVHKAFTLLKADLEVDIETLKRANEKRKLTREESKILKRLQINLSEAEKAISKEVDDIEKEVRS
jgi:hypothetical protein